MSKKPDGSKSTATRRVHREMHPDYPQPYGMTTRIDRREFKKQIETQRTLGLTTRRRLLATVKVEPNSGYRLTLKSLEFKDFVPPGVNLRDFKLARAAAAKAAARRQPQRAR